MAADSSAPNNAPTRAAAPHQESPQKATLRRTLHPTPGAIAGSLALSLAFIVLLPFLVVISFIGQELWRDTALFTDHVFSLPAYLWFAVLVLCLIAVLRIVTQRVVITEHGIKVRGLFRMPRSASWEDISGIWVVRDVFRGKEPPDPVEHELDSAEACLIMERGMSRLANVSGMFYGSRGQAAVLEAAHAHGIRVESIDHARPSELEHMLPGSQTFLDRHPSLAAGIIVLFYVAHNVLTFMLWGL